MTPYSVALPVFVFHKPVPNSSSSWDFEELKRLRKLGKPYPQVCHSQLVERPCADTSFVFFVVLAELLFFESQVWRLLSEFRMQNLKTQMT